MNAPREILIEATQIGNTVRVTAMDADTGTEVVFQAPITTGAEAIKRLAADKIRYVLEKNKEVD